MEGEDRKRVMSHLYAALFFGILSLQPRPANSAIQALVSFPCQGDESQCLPTLQNQKPASQAARINNNAIVSASMQKRKDA